MHCVGIHFWLANGHRRHMKCPRDSNKTFSKYGIIGVVVVVAPIIIKSPEHLTRVGGIWNGVALIKNFLCTWTSIINATEWGSSLESMRPFISIIHSSTIVTTITMIVLIYSIITSHMQDATKVHIHLQSYLIPFRSITVRSELTTNI
jgi:hypothetical protein